MPDYSRDYSLAYDERAVMCTIRFRCFDTPNAVSVYVGERSGEEVEDALVDVRRACLELHRLWSFSLAGSDIERMNRDVRRVQVDARTAELVQAMKDFHGVEPSFDFTIGPVSFLWKHAEALPTDEQLADALAHVGATKVRVDGDYVVKGDPLTKVDVGGAAKGFAADVVAKKLRKAGFTCADVDLGGNLYMLGQHPAGRDWRVSVRIPEGIAAEPVILEVRDKSVVTSGSYERYVELGGKRYQHIVDARTGLPCESDIVSATVVAESSLHADLLATTTCLLGSRGFDELAARHPDCQFVAIVSDGRVLRSATFS